MTNGTQVERDVLEQAVARFFHMYNTHCPGNLAPLLTDDVELLAPEEIQGRDAVHAYLSKLSERYPCMALVPANILVDGSRAAAEVTYTAGPNGSGGQCVLFDFRGDQIRRIRIY